MALDTGPWPSSSDRALVHLIVNEEDWRFWLGLVETAREARKKRKPSQREEHSGKKIRTRWKARYRSSKGSLKGPGLRDAIQILHDITGGFHIRVKENAGLEHNLYLLFNHRETLPPGNLLHVELVESVLEDLFHDRLYFSTALNKGNAFVHGNIDVMAKLEKLLPTPPVPTYAPNIYHERTDHPLDKGFHCHTQMVVPPLKASCILNADTVTREGNTFTFSARGYDVYRTRELGMLHAYDTSEGIPWKPVKFSIAWTAPNVFRLRCVPKGQIPENSTPMLAGPAPQPDFEPEFREYDDRYELKSPELTLVIHRADFRIEVLGPEGRVATMGGRQKDGFPNVVDTLPMGFFTDPEIDRTFAVNNFELRPGEAVFGLGEHYGTVNKRGQTISLWNEEGTGHSTGRNYKNVPFFMSTSGYGVFVNQQLPMTFFVGSRFFPRHEIAAEGELLDMFFFYGPSLKRVQADYTALTGRASMVPKWSFGLWVSRLSYLSQEEVLAVARRIREEGWPADVIHLDTGWFEKEWHCDWRFDRRRFPDPEGMIRELHKANLRVSVWQWPYVADALPLKEEAKARGALARGEVFNLGIKKHHIDFTRPEGVLFYQEQLERLLDMGVDAIKTDFGEYVLDHMEFKGGPGREFKNTYALLYNKAAHEIIQRKKPGDSVLWARSAYAGSQRYPVHWSGDSACTFDDMLCALRGGLSLGLSGFTFWSNDVGGFIGTPSDELFIRWTAWSIFNSHMRLHGGPPRFREPWNYGPEVQEIFKRLLHFRYRLLPYLYSEAKKSARQGLPLLRHLVFEFQEDPTCWNVEDQFLFGSSILVAPILTEEHHRMVWIPPGTWYETDGRDAVTGPKWIRVTADLSRIPCYYRGGHAVAMGPEMNWVDETPAAEMTVKLFADPLGRVRSEIEGDEGTLLVEATTVKDRVEISLDGPARDYQMEFHGPGDVKKIWINGKDMEVSAGQDSIPRALYRK